VSSNIGAVWLFSLLLYEAIKTTVAIAKKSRSVTFFFMVLVFPIALPF
jgi:hypothetical protein